jgi:hypothetical protein
MQMSVDQDEDVPPLPAPTKIPWETPHVVESVAVKEKTAAYTYLNS